LRLKARLARLDRVHVGLLVAITLTGAGVRASLLDVPMRYDEAFTFLNYVDSPLRHILTDYRFSNNHVLNSLLAHGALEVFGDHLWTVRLPGFLAGCALPVAAYLAAGELFDRTAAVWAAALMAAMSPLVDFSVNGRGYALGLLFTLLALWLGARLIERQSPGAWAGFAGCSVLAAYSVPTMAAGVVIVWVWTLAAGLTSRPRPGRWIPRLALAAGIAAAATLVLYLPLLGEPGWHPPSGDLPRSWSAISELTEASWKTWNRGAPHPLDWIVAAGFALSLALHRRIARHVVPLAPIALLVSIAVVAGGRAPPFPRGWLHLLLIYLLGAGAGLAYLVRVAGEPMRRTALASAVGVVCLTGALSVGELRAGQAEAEEVPMSDNALVPYLKRQFPGQRVLVDQFFVGPAAEYYFRRADYEVGTADITATQRAAGRTLVVTPGGLNDFTDWAAYARRVVDQASGGKAAGAPDLVKEFSYINLYDIPLGR
jgi:Dolichyl-phosphate-mannose-protein mannosyltransferase